MNICISCSMPLENPTDIGVETATGPACRHCVGEDGQVRSCAEIFEGGVGYFMATVSGIDRGLAERVTRKNMRRLPFWSGNDDPCLQGEEATDEEFQEVLSKLK